MSNFDTDHLIEQIQAGDYRAQEELFTRHRKRLRRMIEVYLDPRVSARVDPSDVIQDALAKAATRLPQYLQDRPIAFYPWLRQIVRNELIDVHRRHVQAQRRTVDREQVLGWENNDASAMSLADLLFGGDTSPSQHLLALESRERVKTALGTLSAVDRELLLMRCAEQLSVDEIADVLDKSPGAIRSRIRRALQKLSARLGVNQ